MNNEMINEILRQYENGKTAEEVNAMLAEAGCTEFHLDPNANKLSFDEIINGTAGLLDTGTGYPDKVTIADGVITSCSVGDMYALVWVQGKWFKVVDGNKIGDEVKIVK